MSKRLSLAAVAATLLVGSLSLAEGDGKPRPKTTTGLVGKVDGQSLTLIQRGDSGERSHAFKLDAQTKIQIQTDEDNLVKGGEGGERRIPKTRDGMLSDLKTDQRVTVTSTADAATNVLVLRAPKARVKEGER